MFAHNAFEKRQKQRQESIRLRRDFAIICAFVFIIVQLLPASASSSQLWGEICVHDGAHIVLVDQDSNQPAQNCAKCPMCLVRCDDVSSALHQASSNIHTIVFTKVSHPEGAGFFVPGIAKGRHTCRGPPIASVKNLMKPSASVAGQSLVFRAKPSPWSTPWT